MQTLIETLRWAESQHIALGHFNVSTLDAVWAIINSAKKVDVPVVIGVSEGEREFVGIKQLAAVIKSIRENSDHQVFLNADHTYSLENIKLVVEAGYDSVIYDGASLPLAENIRQTKEVVDFVKSVAPHVLVEAEIGYIGKSSALLDVIPENASIDESTMPKPEEVNDFINATGIDLISPAVGNIHGMLKNAPNPKLNQDLIRRIKETINIPMVLHGGSGISDDDFVNAINNGFAMIHINTEIRLAWRDGVKQAMEKDPNQIVPYKLLQSAQELVGTVVEKRLRLFAKRG